MGLFVHHTIIVISYHKEHLVVARNKATELFARLVSNIVESGINGLCSFFIAPNGSKEHWETSNMGDLNREHFKEWLSSRIDIDCEWVEVEFEEDGKQVKSLIVRA